MPRTGALRAFLTMALIVGLTVTISTGSRAGAATVTFWEGIDNAIAYDSSRVPAVNANMVCAQLEFAEAVALRIQIEERTISADLEKLRSWFSQEIATQSTNLSKSIAGVSGALDRLVGLMLNQDHVEAFNNILRNLHADLGLANRYIALNQALLDRVQSTLDQIDVVMTQKCRPTSLTAVFTQALYHTVYTEHVVDPRWSYYWTVSIPADPRCATGFNHNHPYLWTATWYHADTDIGGPCAHTSGSYSNGSGHPGIVKLVVTSSRFVCTLTYHGTLTGTGLAPECVAAK